MVKGLLKSVLGLLLVVGVIVIFKDELREIPSTLRRIGPLGAILIFSSILVQWLLRSLRDRNIFRMQGKGLSWITVFRANNLQLLLNYLPLKAGTVSSGIWLKKHSQIEYRHFLLNMILQNLLTVMVSSLLAAGVLAYELFWLERSIHSLLLLFFLLCAFSPLLIFGLPYLGRIPRFRAVLDKLGLTSLLYSLKPRDFSAPLLLAFIFSFFIFFLSVFRVYWIAVQQNPDFTLGNGIVVGAAAFLSTLASITPAALGIREMALGASTGALGLGFESGVLLSAIERLFVLCAAIGAQLLFVFLKICGKENYAVRP